MVEDTIAKNRTKHQYWLFLVLTYIWIFRDWLQQYVLYFEYFDEAFAFCGIIIWMLKILKIGKIIIYKFNFNLMFGFSTIIFLLCGIWGN